MTVLNDLTTRDQRMMEAVLTMGIAANTKQELDVDTDRIRQFTGQRMRQMATLKYQQIDGLNTALPIGGTENQHRSHPDHGIAGGVHAL